jgi:hypothetical protein
LVKIVHFIMQRKQLLEIARRAEGRVRADRVLIEERASA